MGINAVVGIRKKTLSEWLICLLLVLPFLFAVLNEMLRLPRPIRYLTDVAWVVLLLLLMMCCFHRQLHQTVQIRKMAIWIFSFLVCTGVIYVMRYQSALYYLWGVRNNFRVYAAFFAFAVFVTTEDAENYLSLFDKLFWINAVVSLIQFFGMGLKGDYLGGIFGVERGVNGYTNIFFVIMLTRTLVLYLEKKETARAFLAKCATMLAIAALAELKFFFVEVLVIFVLAILVTGPTWKKVWIAVGAATAVLVGIAVLAQLFPEFKGWFSLCNILATALSDRGYTGVGDLNRLSAISQINGRWLTSLGAQMFGLGLGNCDTASFSFLNTPFFEEFGDLHYSWFFHMHMYLECGWLGLIFVLGFWGMVFLEAWKMAKSGDGMIPAYSKMAMILSVVCVGIMIYNSSLRTEAGYMMYFVLALPFINKNGVKVAWEDGEKIKLIYRKSKKQIKESD